MSQVIHTHISHTQTHDQQKVCLCSRTRAALPHDISRETRHDALPPHTTHLIHATPFEIGPENHTTDPHPSTTMLQIACIISTSAPQPSALSLRLQHASRLVLCDALLNHRPEIADESLHRPGSGIAECADGVALDLPRDLLKHVDFTRRSVADGEALEDVVHPHAALAARRALPTALVLEEGGDARHHRNRVLALVDHRHGARAERRLVHTQP